MQSVHCYPFLSQLVLNLTLALSWVQRGHLLKLCYKRHIRVLHLTVHELAFGGRNREKTEQARTYCTISCITIQCCTIAPYRLIFDSVTVWQFLLCLKINVGLYQRQNYSLINVAKCLIIKKTLLLNSPFPYSIAEDGGTVYQCIRINVRKMEKTL